MKHHERYERIADDVTDAAAFFFSGLLFWAGWLGSFFLLGTVLHTIFGDMPSAVDWALFIGTFFIGVAAGVATGGGFKADARREGPGPLKCEYSPSDAPGYCICGAPKVHHHA